MHPLVARLLERLHAEGILYCLLRDGHALERLSGGGELDLLVSPGDRKRLEALLPDIGFVRLPGWGYSPHRFWVAYDDGSDTWIKLDLVDRIAYGRPVHALATALGDDCLRNRRREGPAFVPSPEDELVTLLLHALLDKPEISPEKRDRLRALVGSVPDEDRLTALLNEYGTPALSWESVADSIRGDDWSMLERERRAVAVRLGRRHRVGTLARQIRDRLFRKAGRGLRWIRPRALTIALLAPDGAGKSTLAASVREGFFFPMQSVYMGLYQKNSGASGRFPLPGVDFFVRLLRQWTRYVAARFHAAQGCFVIFDRYSYDALLTPPRKLRWPARFRRWVLAHSCPAPDLVFVLDAPGEVLHARKGEHTPAELERQRQDYLRLRPHLPRSFVIDVSRDLQHVRREVTDHIWREYAKQRR